MRTFHTSLHSSSSIAPAILVRGSRTGPLLLAPPLLLSAGADTRVADVMAARLPLDVGMEAL